MTRSVPAPVAAPSDLDPSRDPSTAPAIRGAYPGLPFPPPVITNSFAFVRSAEVDGVHYIYGEYPVELAPICYYGPNLNTLEVETTHCYTENAKVDITQVLTFESKIDRNASQIIPANGVIQGIIVLETQIDQGSQPSNNQIRLYRLFLQKSSISSELKIKEIDVMQLGQGVFQDYGWSQPRN
jgi:hypothetical protein